MKEIPGFTNDRRTTKEKVVQVQDVILLSFRWEGQDNIQGIWVAGCRFYPFD